LIIIGEVNYTMQLVIVRYKKRVKEIQREKGKKTLRSYQ